MVRCYAPPVGSQGRVPQAVDPSFNICQHCQKCRFFPSLGVQDLCGVGHLNWNSRR